MSETIRILIADDHELVRKGLVALLSVKPDIEVVGQAKDGVDAVRLAGSLEPDIILMDLLMPRKNGIEATREIKAENPDARILIITSFAEDENVYQAVKAGALGYLLKDSSPLELMQAIHDVCKGRLSLHPNIAMKLSCRDPTGPVPRARKPHAPYNRRVLRIAGPRQGGSKAASPASCLSRARSVSPCLGRRTATYYVPQKDTPTERRPWTPPDPSYVFLLLSSLTLDPARQSRHLDSDWTEPARLSPAGLVRLLRRSSLVAVAWTHESVALLGGRGVSARLACLPANVGSGNHCGYSQCWRFRGNQRSNLLWRLKACRRYWCLQPVPESSVPRKREGGEGLQRGQRKSVHGQHQAQLEFAASRWRFTTSYRW